MMTPFGIKRRRKQLLQQKWTGGCCLFMAIGIAMLNFWIGISNVLILPSSNHHLVPSAKDVNQNNMVFLPPLESILDLKTGSIIGDPQPYLDFAVIGHGKCGTTSLQHWLSEHEEINCPKDEILELSLGTPQQLIERLVEEATTAATAATTTSHEYPNDQGRSIVKQTKLGYKNPGEIRIPDSIRFLAQQFPKTVLIVGIRHPVLWFESLYNFKVQNLRLQFPANYWGNPNDLVGACQEPRAFNCVGTHKGIFHIHLAYLGKAHNISKTVRREYRNLLKGNIIPTPNPVFLFDVDQLQNDDAFNNKTTTTSRIEQFKLDLKTILGLRRDLGPLPRRIPGKVWPPEIQAERDANKIRICDDQYLPVRNELLKIARQTSEFVRFSGFLDHPDVHVSSRQYFEEEIMAKRWMQDPCVNRNKTGK